MLSYDQVKQRVSELSGLVTWKHHMCVDSCVSFTGPFADLVLSRREVSARQDAMTYLVRVRELLSGW